MPRPAGHADLTSPPPTHTRLSDCAASSAPPPDRLALRSDPFGARILSLMQATAPCAPNARRTIWVKARPIRPALPRPQQQQCIRSRMATLTQQSKPNERLAPPQSHAHARAQVQFKFKCKRKRRTSGRQDPSSWSGRGSERDGQEGNNEEEKMAKKGKEGRPTKQIEIGKGTSDRT